MQSHNAIITDLIADVNRLMRRRDELLDALRIAELFVAKFDDDDDYTDGQVETINAIRAAINGTHNSTAASK